MQTFAIWIFPNYLKMAGATRNIIPKSLITDIIKRIITSHQNTIMNIMMTTTVDLIINMAFQVTGAMTF
ncbi:MAG: hypothetical protein IPH88_13000 [Bacteroidales bacterium]|nr:hypothetical protein [Bacteroidales bacterium]